MELVTLTSQGNIVGFREGTNAPKDPKSSRALQKFVPHHEYKEERTSYVSEPATKKSSKARMSSQSLHWIHISIFRVSVLIKTSPLSESPHPGAHDNGDDSHGRYLQAAGPSQSSWLKSGETTAGWLQSFFSHPLGSECSPIFPQCRKSPVAFPIEG